MHTHNLIDDGNDGTHGRIAKGGRHHSWASRDYQEPIKCRAMSCPVNDKAGNCTAWSMSKMNAEGQCETFIEFKRLPMPSKTTGYCRQCGGRAKLEGEKWIHDGERLSHEVVL